MNNPGKISKLPNIKAILLLARRFERALKNDPGMKSADPGDLLRYVPGKRAVFEGSFENRTAVFRMFIGPKDHVPDDEWAEMQRLWPHMKDGPYQIAAPLHYSKDNHIIVVERVSGTPLLEHLTSLKPAQRVKSFDAAVGWLRKSTWVTEGWGPEGHQFWLKRATLAVDQQSNEKLKQKEALILQELGRIGQLFTGHEWRTAISHGDYHPNNLIADGTRLIAIDNGGSSRIPIYKDIARYLVSLGRLKMRISGKKYLGVDQSGYAAFTRVFEFNQIEERIMLPFMIGCEALIRNTEHTLSKDRIKRVAGFYDALLKDLLRIGQD